VILVSTFLGALGRTGFANGKLCQKWPVEVEGLDLHQRVECPNREDLTDFCS